MNLIPEIRKALQFAAIGFAITAIVIGFIAVYHFGFHDIHPIDRENDLVRLPGMILIPSLGLAMLFSLSAVASSTLKNGASFMQSLIVIAGATLISVFATQPRIRTKAVDPDAWLETAIPIATAAVATLAMLIYKRLSLPQKRDDELNIEL